MDNMEMTDKEAADIIRQFLKKCKMNIGTRGNMKSQMILRINTAFTKAINKLEEDQNVNNRWHSK